MIDGRDNTLNDVLGSRSKIQLGNYLSAFPKEEREKVKYVTSDIWRPYTDSCYRYLSNCIVAIDPFHYVKHLCDDFHSETLFKSAETPRLCRGEEPTMK